MDVDDQARLLNYQNNVLGQIAELVAPYGSERRLPMPLKIMNTRQQSSHVKVYMERNRVVVEIVERVRVPDEDVLVISPDGEHDIDLARGVRGDNE